LEAFADGVHHLAAEEFEAALFGAVEGVFATQVLVKVFQSRRVLFCF
jgi:hypothetical protein